MQLLEATFLGNSLRTWLFALGAAILTFIVLRFGVIAAVQRLSGLAKQTESRWDDVITGSLRRTSNALFVVVAIFVGARTLSLSDGTNDVLESLTIIALLVQAGLWFGQGIKDWVRVQREEKAGEDAAAVMTMNVIGVAARLVLWSMVLLLILENVGVDVTALVAGLGIGGIAVALAAQNILGDLFASLSIVLDKPFVLGDFLNVGDFLGTVEEIGLKTTRVRSLSGEQLIFANADLLNSRIRNYGRMFERRVVFKIGVVYQTPRAKLERIPTIIRESIEPHGDRVRFDRSHLQSYGDFAIVFETVYYVLGPDYNEYMDIQQSINLSIHEKFEGAEIEFAYPTQTVFLQRTG
jgi:small-conductance mechanosensitive channel